MNTKLLVDRFLAWPLPESLCSDPCASMPGYPHRTGTNLMTAEQAKAMLDYVLAAPRQPAGWKLVPERMHLDSSVIETIQAHCGDGQEDAGFGPYSDGVLWIGECEEEDGSKTYGLHIATADYPEEGSSTLVEFAAAPSAPATVQCDAVRASLSADNQRITPPEPIIAKSHPLAEIATIQGDKYRCRKCGEKTPPPEPYKAYVLCDCGYTTSATAAIAAARKGEGK